MNLKRIGIYNDELSSDIRSNKLIDIFEKPDFSETVSADWGSKTEAEDKYNLHELNKQFTQEFNSIQPVLNKKFGSQNLYKQRSFTLFIWEQTINPIRNIGLHPKNQTILNERESC